MKTAAEREELTQLWQLVIQRATEGDVEETLRAIADYLERDGEQETHPEVRACLEGAAEHARHAALDYYCSTK